MLLDGPNGAQNARPCDAFTLMPLRAGGRMLEFVQLAADITRIDVGCLQVDVDWFRDLPTS